MRPDLAKIASLFDIHGDFLVGLPITAGHINDTFGVTYSQAGARVRYIIQRINHHVFRNPAQVMENIGRVVDHSWKKLCDRGDSDASRRVLTIIRARDGASFACDTDGNAWRAYLFIEGAHSYNVIETPAQAFEAAKAFGEFQRLLVDFPSPRLHETIKHFHHTPDRFEKFIRAQELDKDGRSADCRDEIRFVIDRESLAHSLLNLHDRGLIPERITHNDTKLNNVLLDDATHEALCIIDLDTTMPGLALYDFGDMVRTGVNSASEDERNVSKVRVRTDVFAALSSGYLSRAGDFLTSTERENLVVSGMLLTYECGIRFLTDYLEGDHYFKTKYPDHNLDRSRNQFRLLTEMEKNREVLERILAQCLVFDDYKTVLEEMH